MVEIFIKIIISLVIGGFICLQILFVTRIWKSHIDPFATVNKIIQKLSPADDVIAIRDSNKIYQFGVVVGDVGGVVSLDRDKLVFQELFNVTNIDKKVLIEYQRYKLQIVEIGSVIGLDVNASSTGTQVRNNVWKNVTCKISQ